MDVKVAYLNGILKEKVYGAQHLVTTNFVKTPILGIKKKKIITSRDPTVRATEFNFRPMVHFKVFWVPFRQALAAKAREAKLQQKRLNTLQQEPTEQVDLTHDLDSDCGGCQWDGTVSYCISSSCTDLDSEFHWFSDDSGTDELSCLSINDAQMQVRAFSSRTYKSHHCIPEHVARQFDQ